MTCFCLAMICLYSEVTCFETKIHRVTAKSLAVTRCSLAWRGMTLLFIYVYMHDDVFLKRICFCLEIACVVFENDVFLFGNDMFLLTNDMFWKK